MTFAFCILCIAGLSQLTSESRADKLWIPQGTNAQLDEAEYTQFFPPLVRRESLLLESKVDNAVSKGFLEAAIGLHEALEEVEFEKDNLRSLCVQQPGEGHPCQITSVLGFWNYSRAVLTADADPLATINGAGKSEEDIRRMLGDASFVDGKLVSAAALSITYFVQSNRELDGGGYADPRGEGWEEEALKLLKCEKDQVECGDICACAYDSPFFTVYPNFQRSFSDAFGSVISGDVGLINGAFLIMIVYMTINLGGLCHKINSRILLALGSMVSIVLAGASGYGLSSWLQFEYTPVHSVLPFVILGIGVDDSFVIMNAFDRTDKSLSTVERMAQALSHAGVSVLVTSLTDFVAFAISVSSALPALSSFCMYAAFSVIMLFLLQLTFFAALATFDARRVTGRRIDCCPCILPRGCPCCPVASEEKVAEASEKGLKDPNQLCCASSKHEGGVVGNFMENRLAPQLVKPPVAASVVLICAALCGVCAWQATQLDTQDTLRSFIPDNHYVSGTLDKTDFYFGNLGTRVNLMTASGDYFESQRALTEVGERLGALDVMEPATGDTFDSWAVAFKDACAAGTACVNVAVDAEGYVAQKSDYLPALAAWLDGSGSRYRKDIVWSNEANPSEGIAAARMTAELKSLNTKIGDKIAVDASAAIDAMTELRELVTSWTDLPGGKAIGYSPIFLTWETFRIIKKEMFLSIGLCLVAVFAITFMLVAHPLATFLIWLCVVVTVVDILGFMNMIGLAIDNVTVIQLVIAVGLCVDYAAHIGHCFMTKDGTRGERVIATLGDVGSAVMNGGISTFLATLMLAGSQSYVFRVLFLSFFLTVVLGLAHGMLLLPAMLALVGPEGYGSSPSNSRKVLAVADSGHSKNGVNAPELPPAPVPP
eukprot:CAMPEP_0170584290 /NCGR_PEP_ID=MMETSP0224-20130122/8611_1 /TAXON_ID=285029 /ORGANISM="Togula jolla, Strain CCCM 725" /LENGTH=883 /DNA_ID=CAMNT_0010907717 /DNA_START=89 /DNA_END=2740 /DNA_ORIENTATION=+